jgi:hypothetical protein
LQRVTQFEGCPLREAHDGTRGIFPAAREIGRPNARNVLQMRISARGTCCFVPNRQNKFRATLRCSARLTDERSTNACANRGKIAEMP